MMSRKNYDEAIKSFEKAGNHEAALRVNAIKIT
jgi:hypothetical protein